MSDIDEIKTRLNIVDIISERIPVKKAGRNLKALCPFHGEKTPSFVISPDRQTFHCFGCGKGGSVFDFVMLYDHVDFAEALETLADRAGVKLEHRPTDTPESLLKQKLYEANHLASEYYHYLLTKHKVGEAARDYLKRRGVSDKSIETFSLGYSANDWDGLLTYLHKKGYDDKLLETAGLVIAGSRGYYDRFRGRVMFTLKDHRGNVVGFAGRVMDPNAKEAKYINTSETPIYTKSKVLYGLDVTRDSIQKANEAVVMEGELDLISSFQAGIGNVVAIKGSAVTEEHARLLRRYTERLVFALDSDLAGDAAARRGIEIAERSGFDMRVATMPSGKDPDEAAREDPVALKKAIKTAVPMYDYYLSSAMKRHDVLTSFGKKKISEEMLPVLAKIENPIVQGHYIRAVSSALSVSDENIQEALVKLRNTKGFVKKEVIADVPGAPTLSRVEKMELYLLALLFQGKTSLLYAEFLEHQNVEDISYPPARKILELFSAYIATHPAYTVKDFADSLPPELTGVFDEAFMWDISGFVEDPERFSREWQKALFESRRLRIRTRIETISKILHDPLTQSEEQAQVLQEEMAELSRELSQLEKGA
ncbi:DNA primase [Candidatus Woesebacteria bacterium]|jgi:DNA primase|nr:DNA primase [Candidatus Woesebacteria bacterium]